jgi:CelD/BcsL family acetyltransferase involved in cellulose biosynthesis
MSVVGLPEASRVPAATPGALRVRVVETAAELDALASDWDALQKDAALTSVFETFPWQRLWWAHYGWTQPLRVLVATDGAGVVGILPVYVNTETALGVSVRLLRFVGNGGDTSPDDLGPILAAGREVEVATALADAALRLPGWDVLFLTDMNPACPFTATIAARARAAGLDVVAGRSERISFSKLPATWDAWLQTLSGDRRYRIKKIRKNLHAAQPSRFFVWNDPATLDAGIDRLIFLHHKRWKSIGQAHAFDSPTYVAFHRAVMKACLDKDWLRLYALEHAGQVVAMYYFYKFRDTVYLMQSGFDPDFSNVKPGQVLLGHIVEHAIGEGHQVLDFLRGDHRYKDELASGERETSFVTAYRRTPGAWAHRARRRTLPAIKAQVLEVARRVRPPRPSKPNAS